MPRIAPIETAAAEPEINAAFEQHVKQYTARITNMKATLAHSLVAFEVYMQWYRLYEEVRKITGNRLAYLFAYAVSYAADCPLCTTFFRKIIIDAGENPEYFKVSDDEQKLLSFGSAVAADKGIVSDEIFAQVSGLYNTKELVVLIAFAGQMIATNIFNNVIETEIDGYLHAYLPPQKN